MIPARQSVVNVPLNTLLQRATRIVLLTEALLPYAPASEPIPVSLLLLTTPRWVLTHSNDLAWPPLFDPGDGSRIRPPEAWCVEQLQGNDPRDPGHWVPLARDGLSMSGGPRDGYMRAGQVIRIPKETLVFGGRAQ